MAIIGVGLLGGSIGLAVKARGLCKHVVGCARTERTLRLATERGAVDSTTHDLREAAAGADFVVLASPIEAIIATGRAIREFLVEDALVTDVGSVKGLIVKEIEPVLGSKFLGGHPMAGGERLGVEYAREGLFEGAAYFLTPTERSDEGRLERAKAFVTALGARVIVRSPEEHDRLVAAVSHLPHVVAGALIGALPDAAGRPLESVLECAGPGFRDTTRIAASDPELWASICLSNREAVLTALEAFGEHLAEFVEALRAGDRAAIVQLLSQAKDARTRLP